jgi:FkbM family methyltransferase
MNKLVNVKVNGNWDIKLPQHRADRPEWYTKEGWERKRLDSMFKTTKPRDIVYYVGAEEGDMCALLQMWGARLLLFEPNPLVWPNIKAIWEANELQPPDLSFVGFAANETDTDLKEVFKDAHKFPPCADGEITGTHGFRNLCEADGSVPKVKIDDLVQNFGRPTMITMDVEGAEWEVLRGAEQTLRKYHPRIYLSLHPEFLYEIYKEYAFDLRNWLKNMGYKETLLD